MLTEDGVKILDFGLAKFADARLKLTLEGSTIGTVAYMSPEQARGEEADARSDVWALGVVLYEMLTGGVPFKGGYPEAISHAIKNEPPAPMRATVPEVSEALEQLVFRALHKDPAVRLQSARELARGLRMLQGRTLPLDLRTEALPAPRSVRAAASPAAVAGARGEGRGSRGSLRSWRARHSGCSSPVERIPVAIAPVVNQTGYAELDGYRLALTRELTAQLGDSAARPRPAARSPASDRPSVPAVGSDVSSREALQALTAQSGARVIVVPTLLYENGSWRARVEFRDATPPPTQRRTASTAVVSSLMKDAVYRLMPSLAARIDEHFTAAAPWRIRLATRIRRMTGRQSRRGRARSHSTRQPSSSRDSTRTSSRSMRPRRTCSPPPRDGTSAIRCCWPGVAGPPASCDWMTRRRRRGDVPPAALPIRRRVRIASSSKQSSPKRDETRLPRRHDIASW